jgi:hypothetical protein
MARTPAMSSMLLSCIVGSRHNLSMIVGNRFRRCVTSGSGTPAFRM